MIIKLIVSQAFFLGKPMRDAAFYFHKPHLQLASNKHHKHPTRWYVPWYCGSVGNKINPCGKFFSHARSFLVMLDEILFVWIDIFSTGKCMSPP